MRNESLIKNLPKSKQIGAVLILMAFIIGMGATAYLLKVANITAAKGNQTAETQRALKNAKQSLIDWSVQHPEYPGQMPFPDRNNDGNYDGAGDCNSPLSAFSYTFLIGKLPVIKQEQPCIAPQSGLGEDFKDGHDNRLWYAVSRNLLHKYEATAALPVNPVINPSVIKGPDYPWMKVFDANGNLLSDRVAAVIIAPNNTLPNQDRENGLTGASQYLDELKIDGVTFRNFDYTKSDEDFIQAPDSQISSSANLAYQQPYYFNDQLVYITVDELMEALTVQVAAKIQYILKSYNKNNARYPNAASLGAVKNNHFSETNNEQGMVPVDITDSCACTSARSCSCGFGLANVTFTRGSNRAFTASTGSCTRSSAACTCSGAGSCSRGTRVFTCTTDGLCTHNINGENRYDFTAQHYMDIPSISEDLGTGCTLVSGKARCTAAGSFYLGLKEPIWFKLNDWQDYFYYQLSSLPNLQAGSDKENSALLIGVGQTIRNEFNRLQIRPSSDFRDYLDSIENTDGDLVFDAVNKKKTDEYNDQVFLISP